MGGVGECGGDDGSDASDNNDHDDDCSGGGSSKSDGDGDPRRLMDAMVKVCQCWPLA